MIVIIRPHDSTSPSDVIKLKAASPEFVQTLEAAARAQDASGQSSIGNMATRPAGALVR